MEKLKALWANRWVKTAVITGAALALPDVIEYLGGIDNVYAKVVLRWLTYLRVLLLASPWNAPNPYKELPGGETTVEAVAPESDPGTKA